MGRRRAGPARCSGRERTLDLARLRRRRAAIRPEHLVHLACPDCRAALSLAEATARTDERIVEGMLACTGCAKRWPIVRAIPRFAPAANYARSFGRQWSRFPKTQYDRCNGLTLYHDRFFRASRWPMRMEGEVLVEAGCGPGAFTSIAVETGATVVSFDLSSAVDVNLRENGHYKNLCVAQGDIRRPPVRSASFDRVLCFGVLQHTPDPAASFQSLVTLLRPGGSLAVDCYMKLSTRKWWTSYYRWRWLTTRLPPALVHAASRAWVAASWPIVTTLWTLPGDGGRNFARYVFLIRETFRRKGLKVTPAFEREWAVMQLVDQLTPRFDLPQTIEEVSAWFARAGLAEVDVAKGDNGIVGRARMPGHRLANSA